MPPEPPAEDPRRFAPSAARNREPLLAELSRILVDPGLVLEVASGSGEHALWFSAALPHLVWQPTDRDAEARASIAAWRQEAGPNLLPALELDASTPEAWPIAHADAVLSVNMVHIAPWAACEGLMRGAARVLPPGGRLILYGPFREGGSTAPGNLAFDADLRLRDPAWGVRERADVAAAAGRHGLHLAERVPMPANNLVLVFRTASGAAPAA